MNSNRKAFRSQSIGNVRFSQIDDNFFKNKYNTINIERKMPNSSHEYKSLFKNYYKSKKKSIIIKIHITR